MVVALVVLTALLISFNPLTINTVFNHSPSTHGILSAQASNTGDGGEGNFELEASNENTRSSGTHPEEPTTQTQKETVEQTSTTPRRSTTPKSNIETGMKRNSLGYKYQERSTTRLWPKDEVMPQKEVRKFFKNTLAIMMMSPPRYHIVKQVEKHYAPFFTHMVFCGPKNNTDFGVRIHGYDIVYGNMQYLAVKNILKHYLINDTMRKMHEPPDNFEDDEATLGDHHITGMIYIADDLLFQPWAVAARNYNKHMPWAVQMGIGHIRSWEKVAAVPMMAVESKFRKSGWPYWRRNHGKMNHALEEGGVDFRARLAEAAKATHPLIYRWSKYNRLNYTQEQANHWTVFYTIIDTYYVPRSMWQGYIDGAELMAKYWVFGEVAIATVLRSLHPTYEEMQAQFYWSGASASDCVRFRWSVQVDCFHRCRHDHVFSELIYQDDDTRNKLQINSTYLRESIAIKGLIESEYKPMQNK